MIDFVQGTLFSIDNDSVIVNVSGIGYKVYVTQPESYQPLLNQSCLIYTHHHIREDWMGLYGFKDTEERHLFRLLLNVSGIGPKGALAIIAQSNPTLIINAIVTEDEKTLVKMPGIGKKTAQRIILDLKDKVKGISLVIPISDNTAIVNNDNVLQGSELKTALKSLGYQDYEINKVLITLSDEITCGESIDSLIKKSLKLLLKG